MASAQYGPAVPEDAGRVVSLADEDAVRQVLIDTLFGLWATVNNLTRLRPSRRERFRVTVFGSARTQPGSWVYDQVRQMSAGLSSMGCDIVTGGGPGLMEAANRGASENENASGAQSIGIRIQLPFEQGANAFVGQAYEHGTFFTRLHQFVLMSDAYVVVPGGVGTLLEAAMVWQLLQVRHTESPLIFVGPMWGELVEWARRYMRRPDLEFAHERDLAIPLCVEDGAAAVRAIAEHHARWSAARGG